MLTELEVADAEGRVGQTLLGKWRLDALLGKGGMAVVYAATHRNGMRGAVKMLHRARSSEAALRRRFRQEGYIANRVGHPGVVRVLDDDVTPDGQAFLVMELLDGSELHELANAAGGRLPVDRMLAIADQLLDGLAAAHDEGVVHRDIKPANVFLTRDGHVKILDFGLARLDGESIEAAGATETGTPMGTPAFMAPEQARGRWDLVGAQSDLWSVGAMMFTLLSGQFVHEEETLAELCAAVFMKPARSLAEALPGAPFPVVAIVDRALRLRMSERWENARAMQSAVRAAYRAICGESLPVLPPRLPRTSTPRVIRPAPRGRALEPSPRKKALHNVTAFLCIAGAMAVGAAAGFQSRGSAFAAENHVTAANLATHTEPGVEDAADEAKSSLAVTRPAPAADPSPKAAATPRRVASTAVLPRRVAPKPAPSPVEAVASPAKDEHALFDRRY